MDNLVDRRITLLFAFCYREVAKSTLDYAKFAALWALIELAREKFPFGGFGWGRIGFSQIQSPLSFYLPLIGVTGLSFLTLIFAVLFADNKFREQTFIALVVIVAFGYGIEKIIDNRISQDAQTETIRLTLIQGECLRQISTSMAFRWRFLINILTPLQNI